MKEVYKNLFIGNDNDCLLCAKDADFMVVHACKTCHQRVLEYSKSLPGTHSNYLIYETGTDLYLNLVDMPNEFQAKFTNPIFMSAIKFIENNIKNKKVLIHCNQGQSRSTSIGLTYLAIKNIIPNASFKDAADAFVKIYPDYLPGNGVRLYLEKNWGFLMKELLIS